jgi:hypothetical protein
MENKQQQTNQEQKQVSEPKKCPICGKDKENKYWRYCSDCQNDYRHLRSEMRMEGIIH